MFPLSSYPAVVFTENQYTGISEEQALGAAVGALLEIHEDVAAVDVRDWAVHFGSITSRTELAESFEVFGVEALRRTDTDVSVSLPVEVVWIKGGRGFRLAGDDPGIIDIILDTLEEGGGVALQSEAAIRPARNPRVRMIYLLPSDQQVNDRYRAGMERAIRDLQSFYHKQLKGKTFSLYDPVVEVVRTTNPSSWYTSHAPASSVEGRFWESVVGDGLALTRGRFDDPANRWIFYIDVDPLCNQYVGGTSGVALLPGNDIRGVGACEHTIWPCGGPGDQPGFCRWVGGLGHELGHAFNLPHPAEGSCPHDPGCGHALMWTGYALYPDAYLLRADKKSLIQSQATEKFFVRQEPSPPEFPCTAGCLP